MKNNSKYNGSNEYRKVSKDVTIAPPKIATNETKNNFCSF